MGRKLLMGVTGLLFCGFLLLHLINNLALFFGEEAFNSLVSSLESIKPIIRILEFVLLTILVVHIYNAFFLMIKGNKARPEKYKIKTNTSSSSFSSRTMIFSGSIILIFLAVHLGTIWRTFQITNDHSQYFNIVTKDNNIGFGNPIITILYMITMILIGIHLKHGFNSSFKTFGIKNSTVKFFLNKISIIFWFFIPFGFFMIALWFGMLKGLK